MILLIGGLIPVGGGGTPVPRTGDWRRAWGARYSTRPVPRQSAMHPDAGAEQRWGRNARQGGDTRPGCGLVREAYLRNTRRGLACKG